MKPELWERLDSEYTQFPMMRASETPTKTELEEAALALGIQASDLDPDYRAFVLRYGGALVGPYPIFGLRGATAMSVGDQSFVNVTKRFLEDGWPGVEGRLVVSEDHAGNPVCLDLSGQIWLSDHDAGETVKVADSFEEYLEECLRAAE